MNYSSFSNIFLSPRTLLVWTLYLVFFSPSLCSLVFLFLLWLWHFWRLLFSYFVECPSVWVWLTFLYKWSKYHTFWQKYHRTDVVSFLVHSQWVHDVDVSYYWLSSGQGGGLLGFPLYSFTDFSFSVNKYLGGDMLVLCKHFASHFPH